MVCNEAVERAKIPGQPDGWEELREEANAIVRVDGEKKQREETNFLFVKVALSSS